MSRSKLFLVTSIVALACADAPTTPVAFDPVTPSFSAGASGKACAGAGATVVNNEADLRAALAAAQPGAVVAVSGVISLYGPDYMGVPEGVTLTCAEEGAGLVAGSYRGALVYVASPNATVSGLNLDGTNSSYPVYVFNGDGRADVTGVTVEANSIKCGDFGCAFIIGATATVVRNNDVEMAHRFAGTGIHMQRSVAADGSQLRIDRSVVEGNVITALVPAGAASFGAIRPRDGTNVIVRENIIRGPWSNGIATTEVINAKFERNIVEGARLRGIFFPLILNSRITVKGSLFRGNDLTSTGGPGIVAQNACNNVFVANRITAPATQPTIAFTSATGANVVLGPADRIEDNGNIDCDGDGDVDPNSISGKTRRGGYAGGIIGPVMQGTSSGVQAN